MNYEQKYKEALGWMQSLYSGLHGKTKEGAERYFPELKESEDERIRKNCINFLELQKEHHAATFEIEECIDWLKSLKSQNQYDKGFNNGYSAAKYNQWKPSEAQLRVLQIAIKDYGICFNKNVLESLYNDLKNL